MYCSALVSLVYSLCYFLRFVFLSAACNAYLHPTIGIVKDTHAAHAVTTCACSLFKLFDFLVFSQQIIVKTVIFCTTLFVLGSIKHGSVRNDFRRETEFDQAKPRRELKQTDFITLTLVYQIIYIAYMLYCCVYYCLGGTWGGQTEGHLG